MKYWDKYKTDIRAWGVFWLIIVTVVSTIAVVKVWDDDEGGNQPPDYPGDMGILNYNIPIGQTAIVVSSTADASWPDETDASSFIWVCNGQNDEAEILAAENAVGNNGLVQLSEGSFLIEADWTIDESKVRGLGGAIIHGEFNGSPLWGPEFLATTRLTLSGNATNIIIADKGRMEYLDVHLPADVGTGYTGTPVVIGNTYQYIHSSYGPINNMSITCDERNLTSGNNENRVATALSFQMEATGGTRCAIQDSVMENISIYGFKLGVSIYTGTNSFFNGNRMPNWNIARCNKAFKATSFTTTSKENGSGDIYHNMWTLRCRYIKTCRYMTSKHFR